MLIARGFVVHFPDERTYGLGMAAFEIGSAYLRHEPLEMLARPVLGRLVARVGETAHLGVLHGAETLYLLKEQPAMSRIPVTLVTDIGVRLPAHLTASGRSILAHLPAAQVRALFPSARGFVDRTGQGPVHAAGTAAGAGRRAAAEVVRGDRPGHRRAAVGGGLRRSTTPAGRVRPSA